MDALASMVISNHIAATILDVAMAALQSATPDQVPVLINFIMEYVTTKNASEVSGCG